MDIKNERGLAFIIVLTLVTLFTMTFAYFLWTSSLGVKATKSNIEHIRAFYLAEAGLERARYDLNQDSNWAFDSTNTDFNGIDMTAVENLGSTDVWYQVPYSATTQGNLLGSGNYNVWLKNIPGGGGILDDEIYVKARGTYKLNSRAIQVKLTSGRVFDDLSGGVTNAIEAEGSITVGGSADIFPEPQEDYIEQYADVNFEDIFGMTKTELKDIARNHFPDTYYGDDPDEVPFSNDPATGLTWIDSPDAESQVTSSFGGENGWGILIVEGDFKITGGNFSGIIYVTGDMNVAAGNPVIEGGIFVECGATIDTTILGNATITFSADAAGDAFAYMSSSLPAMVENWQEVDP